ncbi:MAG: hypothetical protein PHP44_12695 [Kiritimatiellae bacterium]|nr:hypothetical protein [Kiritimatiellia bacterium]
MKIAKNDQTPTKNAPKPLKDAQNPRKTLTNAQNRAKQKKKALSRGA